jgi:DNA-binding LytR/AlgR family response regulator
MKVLIIEDEAPAYRRLSTLLQTNHSDLEIIEVLDSISNAVKWLRNHNSPDLIFSDIHLADGLSFEIFKQAEVLCPIIFTTAYDEYMLDAFKTNGIDYLLKPIEKEQLNRSIEKFKLLKSSGQSSNDTLLDLINGLENREKKYKTRFLVRLGTKLLPVQVEDVSYFYSSQGSTDMILKSGKTLIIDQTLDELQNLLDPSLFFRLNRQFLAHISSISAIHQYFKGKLKIQLHPSTSEIVTVSKEKARLFKKWVDGETSIDTSF